MSLVQAEAIVARLWKLPSRLTRAELVECLELILVHVGTLGPAEPRTLAAPLVEVTDPDQVDDDAMRLSSQPRAVMPSRRRTAEDRASFRACLIAWPRSGSPWS